MRLFEVLLISMHIPYLLWGFFGKRPRVLHWLPVLAVLFTAAHLLLEGYRWQMVPAYLLTADLFLLALLALSGNEPAAQKGVLIAGRVIGMIVLFISIALPLALPVPQLPAPSGPYAVGTMTQYLVDESREEIYTADERDNREIVMQVWYPAAPTGDEAEAVYLPDLEVAGAEIAAQFGLAPFLLDHANLIRLGITIEPPVAEGTFPVIIFAHGLSGVRMQNTTMVRELASHGYIVVSADHTYGNAISVFPDGRAIIYDPEIIFTDGESNPPEANTLITQWADDFDFMLNNLARWNGDVSNQFFNRVDLNRLGLFGHSTGGGATLEFCLRDARCLAGVGLDAWVMPVSAEIETGNLSQPLMFISASRWLGEINAARGRQIYETHPNDAYLLTIAETQHYDFTDIPLLSPLTPQLGLSGSIDSAYSLGMQTEYLLAFFNQYVRGETAPLLTAPSSYPELTLERK